MLVVNYPLDRIDFRSWAQSTLSVERLEDLHLRPDPVPFANYVERLQYYAALLKSNFDLVLEPYLQLVELVVAPLFEGVCSLQRPPSFRCHLAGARTVSAFHRDGDPKYGVTPGTINGWLPLTPVNGDNSIQIETERDSGQYGSVPLEVGQLLLFDAFHLKHGSYANSSKSTRVSFDFRFRPGNSARARELGMGRTVDETPKRDP